MTRLSQRALLAYGAVALLALAVGYLLTDPLDVRAFSAFLCIAGLLLFPLLIKWHHAFLVLTWNASLIVFFLPGEPSLWMVATLLSLFVSITQHWVLTKTRFLRAPAVTWALLTFAFVVALTAALRGGVGMRALGSESYGGKGYFHIMMAILGYFAFTAVAIPPQRASAYASMFVLSGLTALMSHVIYFLGERFYFLYAFFRSDLAVSQALAEFRNTGLLKLVGLAISSLSLSYFMMMRYGIAGILNLRHPLRLLLFLAVVAAGMLSGYRSTLITLAVVFAVQFYFERLYQTWLLPTCLLGALLGLLLLVPLASRLPLPVQRTLTMLPLDLDPLARYDAEASSEWRLRMWRKLVPELPKYLWLGKGYAIKPSELHFHTQKFPLGLAEEHEVAVLAGDYHNGPLSLYIPFGTPGVVAFLFFIGASLRVLYRNYRYGDPSLRLINTFLLTLFVSRTILFFAVFGALNTEFFLFTGIVGFSVSLNGGVCSANKPIEEKALESLAWVPKSQLTT